MKKSIVTAIAVLSVVASSVSLTSCKGKETKNDSAVMTVDINPSVEFVLDENNKVVSATALNDDGAVILSGEVFVGLSAEETAKKVVSVSIETGYISKDDAKNITLTLTSTDADKIYKSVSEKVNDFVKSKGIDSAIKQGKALTDKELKNLLLASDPTLTEEDVKDLTTEELVQKIGEARKEYMLLATNELREAYMNFKTSKITIAEKQETEALIESLGNAYADALSTYHTALEQIDTATKTLNDTYNAYFFDEGSAYQQAVAQVKTARVQVVSVANAETAEELYEVLSGESFSTVEGIDGIRSALDGAIKLGALTPTAVQTAYDTAMATVVPLLNTALTVAQTSLDTANTLAKTAVDTATTALNGLKASLEEIEKNFPTEIKTELTAKAKEIENAVNEAKTTALDNFETEYATVIQRINDEISAQKTALKNAVNQ